MSNPAVAVDDPVVALRETLERQRRAFRAEPMPSADVRRARLLRLRDALVARQDDVVAAVRDDFSARSRYETLLAEVLLTVRGIEYLRRNLGRWMRPESRSPGLLLAPSQAWLHVQPKGVVGVIAPWNYPVNLGLQPLAAALAAGNRVMLKPSEYTPRTSALLGEILSCFDDDLVTVVPGGPEVGAVFAGLPFDHLVFTGSTAVGRKVLRAAAENLVPVTLELGGKSPVIVHPAQPVERAIGKIVPGKLFNAGQTCIACDYALVPRERVDEFVGAFRAETARRYPTLLANDDYTAIVNERHYDRLRGALHEAKERGARLIEVNPAAEDLSGTRKLVPHLVLDAPADTTLMQDEIFGPILPIVPYDTLDQAIDYVNERPRPLALYYFDDDTGRAESVLDRTHSGGVSVNGTLLQFAAEGLPFGGIGPSGMGAVHGREGFDTLSHRKAVYAQSRVDATDLIQPPFKGVLDHLMPAMRRLP